jgi:hypothetical protein
LLAYSCTRQETALKGDCGGKGKRGEGKRRGGGTIYFILDISSQNLFDDIFQSDESSDSVGVIPLTKGEGKRGRREEREKREIRAMYTTLCPQGGTRKRS